MSLSLGKILSLSCFVTPGFPMRHHFILHVNTMCDRRVLHHEYWSWRKLPYSCDTYKAILKVWALQLIGDIIFLYCDCSMYWVQIVHTQEGFLRMDQNLVTLLPLETSPESALVEIQSWYPENNWSCGEHARDLVCFSRLEWKARLNLLTCLYFIQFQCERYFGSHFCLVAVMHVR